MVARGGGLKAVLGASMEFVLGGEGETTLGELLEFNLGLAGAGWRISRRTIWLLVLALTNLKQQ
jgi:hypothetical protein